MKPSIFNIVLFSKKGGSVIFNTLTRSVVKVGDRAYSMLLKDPAFRSASAERFRENFPEFKGLCEMGFIAENTIDEFLVFKYWYNKEKFKNETCVVTFAPLYRCNMRCVYCFEGDICDTVPDMTADTFKASLSFLEKYIETRRPRLLDFNLFGGEPLLRRELAENLLAGVRALCARQKVRVEVNVVTNGTLMQRDDLSALKRLGVGSIQVTIDGERETHDKRRPFKNKKGSFDVVFRNTLAAIDAGFQVVLNMNFDKGNYGSISAFLEKFPAKYRKRVFVKFSPIKVTRSSRLQTHKLPGDESAEMFFGLTKKLYDGGYRLDGLELNEYGPCTFLRNNFLTIDPRGDIGKCIYGMGDRDFVIGNVKDDFDLLMQNVSQFVAVEPDFGSACRECAVLPLCMGGCRRESRAACGKKGGFLCGKKSIENGILKSLAYCEGGR